MHEIGKIKANFQIGTDSHISHKNGQIKSLNVMTGFKVPFNKKVGIEFFEKVVKK